MKKILFNGLGNRGWIGGLYYLKNIIFSCLESEKIKKEYRIVVLIDSAHADIFTCFGNRIDLHIYDGTNKAKLALYEMNLIWLHGVKYSTRSAACLPHAAFSGFRISSTRRCRNSSSRRNWRARTSRTGR